MRLTTRIEAMPGVDARMAAAFGRLGIACGADLLRHLPFRWETVLPRTTIAALRDRADDTAEATIEAEVVTVRPMRGRVPRVEAIVEDETGSITATWFRAPWVRRRLAPGAVVQLTGRVQVRSGVPSLVNPRIRSDGGDGAEAPGDPAAPGGPEADGRLRAVYPATSDLPSPAIASLVERTLDDLLHGLEDHLPEAFRRERELPALADAYRMVHRPEREEDAHRARRRLAYDELLMLQLAVMLARRHRQDDLPAPALERSAAFDRSFAARLPWPLTPDQRQVIDEIAADLGRPWPMNRLLQGDVGAGKTVVALSAMLLAIAGGHQAALMAPTEILAEQHHASIRRFLDGARVRHELLTGGAGRGREEVLRRLADGDLDLVVGTHALISEHVRFRSLGVVVIDEQHRFGVHQRAGFRGKGGEETHPHVLVMTATPIPRTLALTAFGDLDVSTIRHRPPGRRPVITRHVPRARADEVYGWVAERLDAGERAFVVVPAIDEAGDDRATVEGRRAELAAGPLAGRSIAVVHGRLPRGERESAMEAFRRGEVQALVATTVIEVGVDVPEATVIVVEDADRFGLAQLHQLRGRVGRGERRSACVLIADPVTEDARARLEAMVATTDGFEIAERDLAIRGPGEIVGTRQSGAGAFQVVRLPEDLPLLEEARRDAAAWIERSPRLEREEETLLRRRLVKAHGARLGLADVG